MKTFIKNTLPGNLLALFAIVLLPWLILKGQTTSCSTGNPVPVQACTPSGSTPVQLQYQIFGGYSNATPSGTQFIPLGARSSILASSSAAQQIMGIPMTVTSMRVFLSANEGAAATFAVTLQKCTPSGTTCTASSTAATCTVGNSANSCSVTGLSVSVAAGDELDIQSVQTGTGTAAIGGVAISYQ